GGAWPHESHHSTTSNTGYRQYFTGSVSDVAFHDRTLDATTVSQLYGAGHAAAQLMTSVIRPSGKTFAQVTYDGVTGLVKQVTDENGGVWQIGAPRVGATSQAYAGSVLGATPSNYWRLTDTGTPTNPVNQVRGGTATYNNVVLGGSGLFADAGE